MAQEKKSQNRADDPLPKLDGPVLDFPGENLFHLDTSLIVLLPQRGQRGIN